MSKVFHHNDDDGRCAAFLVRQYLINPMEPISPKDFIEYNHSGNLEAKYPQIHEGETVYIVDLSMSDDMFKLVQYVIANGGNVIHIDHHTTGIESYEKYKDQLDPSRYTCFMKQGISGTMLTWIYANVFNDKDREDPNNARYAFDDDVLRTKCSRVNDNNDPIDKNDNIITTERIILNIPTVVRFIDDHDIWKHKINETNDFINGFQLVENKHPLSHIWIQIIDESDKIEQNKLINDIITRGTAVNSYRAIIDAKNLAQGFYITINGYNIACLNTIGGNSTIFQEMYNNSDAVCRFNFDGVQWWYTLYSDADTGADCAAIIDTLKTKYGESHGFLSGGGHTHAAGCTFKKNVFAEFDIDKNAYIEKRKQIKIDKMVAAEQRRIEEERRKLKEDADKLAALRAKMKAELDEEEDYGI